MVVLPEIQSELEVDALRDSRWSSQYVAQMIHHHDLAARPTALLVEVDELVKATWGGKG